MSHTPPAPQHRLADLRDWLMDQIDGSIETRGDDGLISDFIRQIDALSEKGATVEPRGCPTPGSCSAVAEIADLKQRILPQANGRAERAENARRMAVVERDALLEELIVRRTAIANLHEEINGMRGAAPSATAAPDRPDWAQQLPGAELYDRDHGYDRSASLAAGRYVCTCGACSHYDASRPSPTTKEQP